MTYIHNSRKKIIDLSARQAHQNGSTCLDLNNNLLEDRKVDPNLMRLSDIEITPQESLERRRTMKYPNRRFLPALLPAAMTLVTGGALAQKAGAQNDTLLESKMTGGVRNAIRSQFPQVMP